MLENERLNGLLAYLNGLTKLRHDDGYICTKEIRECIEWIREEFDKDAEPAIKSLTDEPTDALKYELMSRGFAVTGSGSD